MPATYPLLNSDSKVTRHAAKAMFQEGSSTLHPSSAIPDVADQAALYYPSEALEVSSDLEDCPELWRDELGRYIMNTYHRERAIETWFESEITVFYHQSTVSIDLTGECRDRNKLQRLLVIECTSITIAWPCLPWPSLPLKENCGSSIHPKMIENQMPSFSSRIWPMKKRIHRS